MHSDAGARGQCAPRPASGSAPCHSPCWPMDRVVFEVESPKRPGSGARTRYKRYNVATTMREARQHGASCEDWRYGR